jgi:transitional endoplasmic reticulum ATPase
MGWELVGSRPDCYETGTSTEFFEGSPVTYFRSITDPGDGFAALQQDESPRRVAGRPVSLSCALRADDVSGWASLWIRVDGTEGGRPLLYKRMESPIEGSREWARYELSVDVPPDATNLVYGLLLHGVGTLSLSQPRLTIGGEEEPTLGPGAPQTPQRMASPVDRARTPRSAASGLEVLRPDDCPTFADIGGMQSVKDQLTSTVGMVLADPARAAALKVSFTGVLLYGPLGSGKSLFARAIAGEYRCNLVLALAGELRAAPSEVIAHRLDEAFELARSRAPAVLFFDEFDWLWTQADRKPVLEALMQKLQRRLDTSGDDARVIPVAATQALDDVDPAAIPSGLFDLKIRVGLPDRAARAAIIEAQLRRRPVAADVDSALLAAVTDGLSAAALIRMVNDAALKALGRRTEPAAAITQADLITAISERGGRDRPAVEQWSWDALILSPETKLELQELQRMIEDPARAERFGIRPPRGALLYGPPGTGKTTIARVLAAQAKTSFYPIKGSDIVSKWLGESEQKVHEVFVRARENRPSIIFLDEIDALGAARGDNDSGAMDRILNQLLQEIDGLQSGPGVFVLGATNRRDLLDEALIRGGRLGRQIEIPAPDLAGRAALLRSFTKSMPLESDVDIDALATGTAGMSGADLQQLCQQAAIHAMMANSAGTPRVGSADFEAARALAAHGGAVA